MATKLKTVADPLREELAAAIAAVEVAQRDVDAANDALDFAQSNHRKAKDEAAVANHELNEATNPTPPEMKPHNSWDSRELAQIEERKKAWLASRPPVHPDEVRRLRTEAEAAGDHAVFAQSTYDVANVRARGASSTLNAAKSRREKAVAALVASHADVLINDVAQAHDGLLAARAALKAAGDLMDARSEDWRRVNNALSGAPYPEEQGIVTGPRPKRVAAIQQWAHFKEKIERDGETPLP